MFSTETTTILALVTVAVIIGYIYLYYRLTGLEHKLNIVGRALQDKVSETLFRLEQDNRKQDTTKLDSLIAHLNLEAYNQPQQTLYKKKHE